MYKNVLEVGNKTIWTYIHITIMHINIILLLASFLQTIISDPGKVPLFWGFFLDDPDHKRRRYCLICHIFKPERSHHCSACNRCVLNMDHHCPWLNNCIGFYNRKYFLLLLFYAIVSMAEICIYYLPTWLEHIIFILDNRFSVPANPYYLTVIFYLINTGMFIVVSMFFRFHVTLVIQNLTTIEHMDRKRGNEARNEVVNYDMGVYYNFIQIFGKNPWLWFLPVTLKSGKPVGDGVVWPQKPSNAQKYEIDMSIRNVGGATSEHGSATRDRTSQAHNEPTPNERTPPFTSGQKSYLVHQHPPEGGYNSQSQNLPNQGNYIVDNYRAEDRLAQFGAYDNQLSDRSRQQMYGGMNYGGAGSYGQNPAGFDQTQHIDGYPSQRSNLDRWNMA